MATSQKYYPAENFLQSFWFSRNPVEGTEKSHCLPFNSKPKQNKTVNNSKHLQGTNRQRLSQSCCVPPSVPNSNLRATAVTDAGGDSLAHWQHKISEDKGSPQDHQSFRKWLAKHRMYFQFRPRNLGAYVLLLCFNFPLQNADNDLVNRQVDEGTGNLNCV